MAQIISVRLQRGDNTPWGFRLQGGKDFGSPLVIQKVNGNSIAERAGLQAGDAVIRVNSTDIFSLRHKEAQDAIVRAGQNFELTVQRGSQTWKPAVTPVGSLPSPKSTVGNVTPVTKTSLAANKPAAKPIGSAHNVQPKPFLNGSSDGPKLVNKQYNSPIGLYSEESIAETLSAQAEVLPTGALGVNFKKNERHYDAQKSEVLKMLQETENEPRDPEPEKEQHQGVVTSPAPVNVAGLRHVTAPNVAATQNTSQPSTAKQPLAPGQNICADCERLIVGVFVRIKDKNLHVECFKCSTCGSSLKNVGYYNINNKLYCDVHAKLAARSNQPAPNMVPITIPPGGKAPAGAISAAIASHGGPISPSLPSTGNAPLPYTIMNCAPVSVTNGHGNVNGNGSHDYTTHNDKFIEVPPLRSQNIEMFANKLKIEPTVNNNSNERKINRAVLLNNDHLDTTLLPVASNGQHNLRKNGLNAILHENKKTYLTEAKIRVNNNFNCNNESLQQFEAIIDVNNRLQNNKPPPSVLGPKPFSSSTAPLSPVSPVSAPAPSSYLNQAATLPRAATQNQQPVMNNTQTLPKKIQHNGFIVNYKDDKATLRISNPPLITGETTLNNGSENMSLLKSSLNSEIRNFKKPNLKTINYDNTNFIRNSSPKPFIQNGNNDLSNNCKQLNNDPLKQRNNFKNTTQINNIINLLNEANLAKDDNISVIANGATNQECCVALIENNKSACEKNTNNSNKFIVHENNTAAASRGNVLATSQTQNVNDNNVPIIDLVDGSYPVCVECTQKIRRGPFITALGKIWCPEHFVCATPSCRRALQDLGFVEERGQLYCEYCFEQYLAPVCDQCHSKIKGDCLKAIGKHYHPDCFSCAYCKKLFGNSPFFLEDGLPYCEADWNELFTTKCFACGFPVEAGDRWVEALNNNYHSQCFNCTTCKKNLEGQSFFAKGGRPFCKLHAR